jgi:hypothetical protein
MLCELSGYGSITALGEVVLMNAESSSYILGWYHRIRQDGLSNFMR